MDYRAGAAFTVGILAALLDRGPYRPGQHVDFSSREVFAAGAPDALLAHVIGCSVAVAPGNGHRTMAPHDVYPCAEGGWLAVAVACRRGAKGAGRGHRHAIEGHGSDGAIREWTADAYRPRRRRRAVGRRGPGQSGDELCCSSPTDPHLAARAGLR